MAKQKSQLTLFGPTYIPPLRLATPIGDVTGDPERFIEERRQEWERQIDEQKEKLWAKVRSTFEFPDLMPQTYAELKKTWKVPSPPQQRDPEETDPSYYREIRTGLPDYVVNRNANFHTSLDRSQKIKGDAWARFEKLWNKEQRERIDKLKAENPELYKFELEMGGVDLDPTDSRKWFGERAPALDSFVDGLISSTSFGLVSLEWFRSGGRKSRIYGDDINANNWKSYGLGNLIGELTTIAFLGAALGSASKLKTVARIGNVLKKYKKINSFLQLTGAPGAILSKGFKSWRTLSTYYGLAGMKAGAAFGLKDYLQTVVKNNINIDNLSDEEWKNRQKENPALNAMYGFLKGYGITVANAPTSLLARVALDGVWSTANQGYSVMTGQQKGWNNEQFLYDLILSNVIGERGIYFRWLGKPFRTKVDDPLQLEFKRRSDQILEKTRDNIPAQDADIKKEIAGLVSLNDLQSRTRLGVSLTDDQVKNYTKMYSDKFDESKETYLSSVYDNFIHIPNVARRTYERTEAYKTFFSRFLNIDRETFKMAQSPEGILDIIKAQKAKSPGPLPVKGINSTDLLDGIDVAINRHVNNPAYARDNINQAFKQINELKYWAKDYDDLSKFNFYNPDPDVYDRGIRRIAPDPVADFRIGEIAEFKRGILNNVDTYYAGKKATQSFKAFARSVIKNKEKLRGIWGSLSDQDKAFALEDISARAAAKAMEFTDREVADILDTNVKYENRIKKAMSSAASKATWEVLKSEGQRVGKTILDEEIEEGVTRLEGIAGTTEEGELISSVAPVSKAQLEAIDLKTRKAAYDARKETKYKDRDNTGIDPGEHNNRDYAVMREIANSSPSQSLNTLIRFWKTARGVNDYQVQSHLAKYGIVLTTEQIADRTRNYRVGGGLWQGAEDKIRQLSPAGKNLTDDDIDTLWKRAVDDIGTTNDITGLNSNINTYTIRSSVAENGTYVISDRRWIDSIRAQHGNDMAREAHVAVGEFIRQRVAFYNKRYETKKTLSRAILRNPEFNESTDFVLVADKIPPKELFELSTDIFNLLTNQYPMNKQGESRAFAVLLGDKVRIHKAEGATISFTRDFSSIEKISDMANFVQGMLNASYPGSKDSAERLLLNYNDPNVRDALDALTREKGAALINKERQLDKVIDGSIKVQNSQPSIIEADNYAEASEKMGTTPRNLSTKRALVSGRDDDSDYKDYYKQFVDDDYTDKAESAIDFLNKDTANFRAYLRSSNAQAEEGLVNRVKTKGKELFDLATDYVKRKSTNLEGKDSLEEASTQFKHLLGDKEQLSTITANRLMVDKMGDFFNKYAKGNENAIRRDVIIRLMLPFREEEVAHIYDNKIPVPKYDIKSTPPVSDIALTRENQKPEALDMLREPIKNDENLTYYKWRDGPNKFMTQESLVSNKDHSKDKLLFGKILVQRYGIDPQDLLDFAVKTEDLWNIIKDTVERTGGYEGAFKKIEIHERIALGKYESVNKFLRKYATDAGEAAEEKAVLNTFADDAKPVDKPGSSIENILSKHENIDDGLDAVVRQLQKIRNIMKSRSRSANPDIANFTDETFYRLAPEFSKELFKVENKVNELINYNPTKLKYTSHRILADPDNKKLSSIINRMASESGRQPWGEDMLRTDLRDVRGKQFFTALGAMRAGYTVEMNGIKVMHSVLRYSLDRLETYHFAQTWKKNSQTIWKDAIDPIKTSLQEFDKLVKNTEGFREDQRWNALKGAATKIFEMKDEFYRKIGDHKGYWWRWNSEDDKKTNIKISNLKREIDKTDPRNPEFAKLSLELKTQQGLAKTIDEIYNYEGAYPFTKAFEKILDMKEFKITGDRRRAEDSILERQRSEIRQGIRNALYGTGKAQEQYMTLNAPVHNRDSRNKAAYNHRAYLYDDFLSPTIVAKDGLRSPSLPGFEGLYVDRALMKEMNTLLFKNDPENVYDKHEFKVKVKKGYTKMNNFMKRMQFIRPLLMAANNMGQTAIGLNPASLEYGKSIQFGYRAMRDHGSIADIKAADMDVENPAHFYWLMNRENLYHKHVGISPVLGDARRLESELAGDTWGKMVAKELFAGDTASAKSSVISAIDAVFKGFRLFQDSAWTIDTVQRTATAKIYYNRIYKQQLGILKDPKLAKAKALTVAADETNKVMADYSEMPYPTRLTLNRLFFTPNYRLQEAKILARAGLDFLKGIKTVATGKITPHKFQTSDSIVKESMRLMGPVVRKVIFTAAIKYAYQAFFGINDEGLWNDLTSYRMSHVVKPGDPLNSYIKYLSLSTPMFALEKYITRPVELILRYNMAILPGLGWSLFSNRQRITGQRIFDAKDSAVKASAKVGLYTLQTFFPITRELMHMGENDVGLMGNIMNSSGLGYVYKTDSPQEILNDYYGVVDKTRTVGERERALSNLQRKLNRVSNILMNRSYTDMYGTSIEAAEKALETKI